MLAVARRLEVVSRACGYAAALLLLALIALMVYEVVVRYALAAPTIWGYDVTTMVMGASFVFAISYALATDSHVRIDLLHARFGPRVRPVVDLVGYGLVLLPIVAWLAWGMFGHFHHALASGETSGLSAWNPKVWPFRLALVVGVLAWLVQIVAEILRAIVAVRGGEAAPRG